MKVFLGGTCNESTWRDNLIPMLTIDYFNPVVEDWTEDCMKQELLEREISDFVLYVITPKMIGAYAIAEVVDDSNKRPEKTIFVLLRSDGDLNFKDAPWKSLQAVGKMVLKNGGEVFNNLKSAAAYMNTRNSVEYKIDCNTIMYIRCVPGGVRLVSKEITDLEKMLPDGYYQVDIKIKPCIQSPSQYLPEILREEEKNKNK